MYLLTNNDKTARCLCGLPLFIDDFPIPPITVRKVIEAGESKYNLSLLLITSLRKAFTMISKDIDLTKLEEINDFELIVLLSNVHEDFCNQISESIEFFIDHKVKFNKQNESFDILSQEETIVQKLNNDNYQDFINIIKLQNYNKDIKDSQDVEVDKKTAELLKRREETREKLRKAKGDGNNGSVLTYTDYISVLSAKSLEMSIEKCLNMTVFAFFMYLERLALIDSYEIGIQQLMAGAKPNQVNLKHWLSEL